MNTDRKTALYVSLIFLSGLLVGGIAMNLAEHYWLHPRLRQVDLRQTDRIVKRMTQRLKLTPEQQAQVGIVLQQAVQDYQQLQEQLQPEYDAVKLQGRERIRAILTPEQRVEFERIVQSVDAAYPVNERVPVIPVPSPAHTRDVSHISTPQNPH